LHLAPRTTNPAATNSATTNLETRSYHPTLPIPPLPISQFATTCCIFNCVHTLIGIFHAPRASRYQSRRYQSPRYQSRPYQSRNSQLPAEQKFVSIPYLEYSSNLPPRAYQLAPTSAQGRARVYRLAATGCRRYRVVLTASQLSTAASQIATRRY
jgi:hypothetical protein